MKTTIILKSQNKSTKIKDLPIGTFFDLSGEVILIAGFAPNAPGRCYIALMDGIFINVDEEIELHNEKILNDVSISFE